LPQTDRLRRWRDSGAGLGRSLYGFERAEMRSMPLILFGLAGAIGVLFEGRHLELHSATPLSEQTYPWVGVGTFVSLVVVETFIVWLILRPNTYAQSWGRVLVSLVSLVSLAAVSIAIVYWGAGIMHQPDYYFFHLDWLLLFWVGLFVKRRITKRPSGRKNRRLA